MQTTLCNWAYDNVDIFGTCLTSSNCIMLLQNWFGSRPNLLLARNNLMRWVDLVTWIALPHRTIVFKMKSPHSQNDRLVSTNSKHLGYQHHIRQSVSGRAYSAAVRCFMLHDYDSMPTRVEDMQIHSLFGHRCLRSIDKIWWHIFVIK